MMSQAEDFLRFLSERSPRSSEPHQSEGPSPEGQKFKEGVYVVFKPEPGLIKHSTAPETAFRDALNVLMQKGSSFTFAGGVRVNDREDMETIFNIDVIDNLRTNRREFAPTFFGWNPPPSLKLKHRMEIGDGLSTAPVQVKADEEANSSPPRSQSTTAMNALANIEIQRARLMSLISKVLGFFTSPSPKPTDTPAKPSPKPSAAPAPVPLKQVRIGIDVALVNRFRQLHRTLPFAVDTPEVAFEMSLSVLMSEPLLFGSITGVRHTASGARETIFVVEQSPNYGSNSYDYASTFPGSWSPPEHYRETQRIPM